MSVIKILGVIALVPLAIVFMQFGTISPCGMLRENIKQHDKLAAHLPDGLIEAGMSMQYGNLSPSRCLALLAGSNNTAVTQSSSPVQQLQAQQQPRHIYTPNNTETIPSKVKAVVESCKNKRISGELKNFVASANCSNPLILEIYQNAQYPYMDLIGQLTAKRLEVSEKIDAGTLTEGEAQLETAQFITHLTDLERERSIARR
jgi:hypothetical protein